MNFIKGVIFTLFLFVSSSVFAEPLPNNDEWYFFAVVNCDSVVLFSWYTPDGGKIVPVGKIQNEKMVEEIMEAKEKAEENGNAYQINVGEECPRI